MNTKKVNKSEYEIFEYSNGYFGISKIGTYGGEVIFAGDSANEDDYNRDYIEAIYEQWDGTLHQTSDWIGHEDEYWIR